MGLENRDYLRDEARRYSSGYVGGGSGAPMCKRIIVVTVIVYVAQLLTFGPRGEGSSLVQNWLQLETSGVLHGQIWRVLTCAVCHDLNSPFHILINMYVLWMFGQRIESMYGSQEFGLFYVAGAIAASVAYMLLDAVTGQQAAMIGASGAVFAVTMVYALHYPTQILYLFFVIPVQVRWLVVLLLIYDLHPVIMALSGNAPANDSVAHAAHLGGLAFGYYYGKKQARLFPAWSRIQTWWRARRKGLKVVRPSVRSSSEPSEKLTTEMDAILQKISEHGEASLTRAERKTLEKASRELRDRRG